MFSWSCCPMGFKTKISYFIFGQFWNCTHSLYKAALTTKREVERNLDLFLTGSFNSTLFTMWFISNGKKGKGAEPMSFNNVAMLKLLNCSHVLRIKLKFLFHFKPALIYLQKTGFLYICTNPCVITLFTEYYPSSKPAAWNLYRVLIIGNALILFFTQISLRHVLFRHGLHSAVSASVKISWEIFLLVYVFKKYINICTLIYIHTSICIYFKGLFYLLLVT